MLACCFFFPSVPFVYFLCTTLCSFQWISYLSKKKNLGNYTNNYCSNENNVHYDLLCTNKYFKNRNYKKSKFIWITLDGTATSQLVELHNLEKYKITTSFLNIGNYNKYTNSLYESMMTGKYNKNIFSYKGRIGRIDFFLSYVYLLLISFLLGVVYYSFVPSDETNNDFFKTNKDLNDVTDCLCLIKSGKTKGFGFFIKINWKFLPFKKSLLTSVSILAPNDIKNKKEIILDYKNSEKILKINDDRKIISDNDLGYICIEIIDEDEIDNFLKLEKNIFNLENSSFINKKIFIPKYQNNKDISFSSGNIISNENNKLEHDCDIKEDSLGAPIIYEELSYYYVIGLQKGYETNNKYFIGTSIIDIVKNIMHQQYPIFIDKDIDIDFKYLNSLSDNIIKILNYFKKIEENSFLSIISNKFNEFTVQKLAFLLSNHLNMINIYENYQKELINYYTTKTKIIYDTNIDDDSIINFMSKVYGKSNLACFYDFSFSGEGDEIDEATGGKKSMVINSKNFAFLNGKFEFISNNFDFGKNNIFIFGNYGQVEDDEYDFVSFKQQDSSLLTKIKDNAIYCLFYRDLKDMRLAIKIENNFMKNKILLAYDEEFYNSLVEKFEEDEHFNGIDEMFENLDDSKKVEVNFKELIIYEIDN